MSLFRNLVAQSEQLICHPGFPSLILLGVLIVAAKHPHMPSGIGARRRRTHGAPARVPTRRSQALFAWLRYQ